MILICYHHNFSSKSCYFWKSVLAMLTMWKNYFNILCSTCAQKCKECLVQHGHNSSLKVFTTQTHISFEIYILLSFLYFHYLSPQFTILHHKSLKAFYSTRLCWTIPTFLNIYPFIWLANQLKSYEMVKALI